MSEYLVSRTSVYSGSSNENIQKRSIADMLFVYASRKNYPMVYGIGGMVPENGKWVNVKGAFRTGEMKAVKHEWYDEDVISFETTGGATATAIATTGTSFDMAAAADYNKLRLGEVVRCKNTGDKFLVTALGTSPAITLKSLMGATKTIPANATILINSRAVHETSSAGSERDSLATNAYNLVQNFREDASISSTAEKIMLERNGPGWDEKGRRKAKSMHAFMRYMENALTLGYRQESSDASSNTVTTMGGIDYYIATNILAANAADSSAAFGYGHGGEISYDEFVEAMRIMSKHYDKGDTVGLLCGSVFDKCFTKWAMQYPGTQFAIDTKKDEFGFAITKIKTPYLNVQLIGSGCMEENAPNDGLLIDPKLIRIMFLEKPTYVEVDMRKTANRQDSTAWTWFAKMSLELLGEKRFGKISGVTGPEL